MSSLLLEKSRFDHSHCEMFPPLPLTLYLYVCPPFYGFDISAVSVFAELAATQLYELKLAFNQQRRREERNINTLLSQPLSSSSILLFSLFWLS